MSAEVQRQDDYLAELLLPHDSEFIDELLNVAHARNHTDMPMYVSTEMLLEELQAADRYVGQQMTVTGWICDEHFVEPVPLYGRVMEYRGAILREGEVCLGVYDHEGDVVYAARLGEVALRVIDAESK